MRVTGDLGQQRSCAHNRVALSGVIAEMSNDELLLQRIESRTACIAVIGLGYVGLPLAVEFARAGFSVVGIERNAKRVSMVNRGENYIPDVLIQDLADVTSSKRLIATQDFSVVSDADAVLICVPTPLDKNKQPDTQYIKYVVDQSVPFLHEGMVIVLESTTYPGTTEEIIQKRVESAGFEVGRAIFLAFSPERVNPGDKVYKTRNTPKVVGGATLACTRVAASLYRSVIEGGVVTVSSPRAAEMTKLLENTFRIVNISLVNELAQLCERMGIDIWEVIEASSTKPFGFMPFYPGPGLGGHCIPLDPFYLSWKAKEYDFTTQFIELAGRINDAMPYYVVERAAQLLNTQGKPLKGSLILLVGMAYKKDIDDLRQSPALKVAQLLIERGARVSYHDPFIPRVQQEGVSLESVDLDETTLRRQDIVLITTGHSCVDYTDVVRNSSLVFDTRNATRDCLAPHVSRLGAASCA